MKVIFKSILIFVAYLVGSIPTAVLFSKLHGIDITKHGSGNSGATNVGRKLGACGFIVVFLIDCLKAFFFLTFLQMNHFSQSLQILSAVALLLGNGFSPFLAFKGGKGVATSVGVLCVLTPYFVVLLFFGWLLIFYLTKTVGIASVLTFLVVPIFTLFFGWGNWPLVFFSFFVCCWGVFRHAENIRRYFNAMNYVKN